MSNINLLEDGLTTTSLGRQTRTFHANDITHTQHSVHQDVGLSATKFNLNMDDVPHQLTNIYVASFANATKATSTVAFLGITSYTFYKTPTNTVYTVTLNNVLISQVVQTSIISVSFNSS